MRDLTTETCDFTSGKRPNIELTGLKVKVFVPEIGHSQKHGAFQYIDSKNLSEQKKSE